MVDAATTTDMTLREKQSEFGRCVVILLMRILNSGYEFTFGDAYRPPDANYGHPNSTHKRRLAIDINLFFNGEYLESTVDHEPFGEFWESLHPLARWGGRFRSNPDGNHYSFEHEGVK